MKKINVTLSIPTETNGLLHALISKKMLSTFVATALNKALEDKLEELKSYMHELKKMLIEKNYPIMERLR